jgi:catechol-2,3-dioxygenase
MAITHLRHVGIFSPDLSKQREFYGTIWGLDQIAEESAAIYFRGASPEHHLLAFIRKSGQTKAEGNPYDANRSKIIFNFVPFDLSRCGSKRLRHSWV